jgi:hypothetical protein
MNKIIILIFIIGIIGFLIFDGKAVAQQQPSCSNANVVNLIATGQGNSGPSNNAVMSNLYNDALVECNQNLQEGIANVAAQCATLCKNYGNFNGGLTCYPLINTGAKAECSPPNPNSVCSINQQTLAISCNIQDSATIGCSCADSFDIVRTGNAP